MTPRPTISPVHAIDEFLDRAFAAGVRVKAIRLTFAEWRELKNEPRYVDAHYRGVPYHAHDGAPRWTS